MRSTSNLCRRAYETRVPPRVVSVAGVGVEPTDSERMKLVSHRCSIPAASSPGVEPGTQPLEGHDRPTTKRLVQPSHGPERSESRRRRDGASAARGRCGRDALVSPGRVELPVAGFVDLLPTVGGDVASHGGIAAEVSMPQSSPPTVVGLRIQRPRPLDGCDMAPLAGVEPARLRLEDAEPSRRQGRSRRAAESNRAPRFCRSCRSRNSAPLEPVAAPSAQRALGSPGGIRTRTALAKDSFGKRASLHRLV